MRRFGLSALCVLCVAVLCLAALCHGAAGGKDYYSILGVARDASQQEIKRQYKTLSRKHHPDKNPGDEQAHERFIAVAEAYEVLTDAEKREIYNRYGEDGLRNQAGAGGFHDPFDIFAQFFGGPVRFDRRAQRARPRGPDVHVRVPVTLRELYAGAEIDVAVSKHVTCPHCDGDGAASHDDVETCSACGGSGVRVVKHVLGPGIVQQMQSTCDACGGKGSTIARPCPRCAGARVVRDADSLTVRVEPGMQHGAEIAFDAEADQIPDHDPGAVVFHLVLQPHAVFTRHGDDLHADVTISLLDALLGFARSIPHVDPAVAIELSRAAVTPPGFVHVLHGKGMPRRPLEKGAGAFGDMHITYSVQFPAAIDSEARGDLIRILGGTSLTATPPGSPPLAHDEL
ncbi:DnaJ- protein scj1 [Coemansia thaxteri]|nr:DnaJ- protein scj1 [Coemansia thaxteri]